MAFGEERNTGVVNPAGVYQDPQSKAILEVGMPSGADALVRLGWNKIGEHGELDNILAGQKAKPEVKEPSPAPENINVKG